MNAMIDYIGSMIAGGAVFIMMLSYYMNVSATAITQLFNTNTQEDLTSITEIIESDFRKAGFGVKDSLAFTYIDSSRVSLRGDFDNNGTIDTVRYWLSYQHMPGSDNPNARILYRRSGSTTVRLATNGVTRFRLWYYNDAGAATTDHREVSFVRVALNCEGKISYQDERSGAYWERTLRPQNAR